ncbi:hypothetical protein BLA29_010888, partial [Euroglyphus maynei]
NHDKDEQQSPVTNDDAKIESNSNTTRNRRQATSAERGAGGNSVDKDDSISFMEESEGKIYSYQYGVNLAMYIIIYASQVNGFFAYIWSHHSWLTLHLTIVAIQIVFLLFLSIVNIRLIIVLLFRMMLFFMSLFRSLEISNYQMTRIQRQAFEIQSELPRVKIFTPNKLIVDRINKPQQHRRTFDSDDIGKQSTNKSGQHKTVSDQNGRQVGYVTLSVEMERSSSSTAN